ncbi:hypothetical protein ISF_06885 [Cordyceps fumosorosea ARSEF 2679]|uniref:EXPERA domain-containing protein n=1 Tax=Cordyceps fumosorosea (strain ARSEF 2679) TaxID=1081104 RepID=A0A167R7L5_CORFA|nr:hypothetical protein ISF_06885 [Cordyceps fumosorosea ARSEF 2679]OAA58346.1 hypothetical protein ISF_06885 [Cordyceps fumosorosea ARSEF 2679]
MANKPLRDWLYLVIIALQLIGMIAMDLVEFYPRPLWEPAGSPLHFLVGLRRRYVAASGDPFVASAHPPPWFVAFLYIEGLAQCPLAAYLVSQLSASRRKCMGGPGEVAGLAFGCLTFMGSATCCYELLHMGPAVLAADKKTRLLYGTYLPYVIIPGVMAVDMALRLLRRVQEDGVKDKNE